MSREVMVCLFALLLVILPTGCKDGAKPSAPGEEGEKWFQRGYTCFKQDDLDGAIADYSKAIEINSSYDMAYANRGLVRLLQARDKDAEADFEKAVSLRPDLKPAVEQAIRETKAKRAKPR